MRRIFFGSSNGSIGFGVYIVGEVVWLARLFGCNSSNVELDLERGLLVVLAARDL